MCREIHVNELIEKIAASFPEACYNMREDVLRALQHASETEISPTGRHVLDQLVENALTAREEKLPFCHDTGVAILLIRVGQDVRIVGGSLTEALNEGVRRGYVKGYLRASIVKDPFDRVNTEDNTPAIIHYDIVPGNRITVSLTAKGGGSENKSRLAMLKPSDGIEEVKNFVVETVSLAGPNACPPMIVGVGVGGSFDYSAYLAKKALFREIGSVNADPNIAILEDDIHQRCNRLGVGPQGMGGIHTVLDVFVEVWSCHITSLPVAVNLQCPAQRFRTIVI
jgi:fumarate hydratase subunit alpha